MPYVRETEEPSHDAKAFVDRLVTELSNPKEFGQPLIWEKRTPSTKSIQVHVVWDDWQDCPRQSRENIIREAYEHSGKVPEGERIALAVGLTVPEAVAFGLLPIQVVSQPGSGSTPTREQFRRVALKLGASTLRNPQEPELRCATLEQAQATIDRLQEELPGSKWMVAREIHVGDDY
jgi:hypothetical protein